MSGHPAGSGPPRATPAEMKAAEVTQKVSAVTGAVNRSFTGTVMKVPEAAARPPPGARLQACGGRHPPAWLSPPALKSVPSPCRHPAQGVGMAGAAYLAYCMWTTSEEPLPRPLTEAGEPSKWGTLCMHGLAWGL